MKGDVKRYKICEAKQVKHLVSAIRFFKKKKVTAGLCYWKRLLTYLKHILITTPTPSVVTY